MAQITLQGPKHPYKGPNTRDETPEDGWNFNRIIDAINAMFTEVYAALGTVHTAPTYTVATAPDAAEAGEGAMIYVKDGAAGSPILAFSDGTNWLRSDDGTAIASA